MSCFNSEISESQVDSAPSNLNRTPEEQRPYGKSSWKDSAPLRRHQHPTLTVDMIWGRLSLQQLGAGPGFPSRDGAGSRQWERQILATRPVASDKGPSPCRKEFPQRQKVVKQVNYSLEGKRVHTVHLEKHTGRLRGRVPELLGWALMAVWIAFMGYFSRLSFGQSFWFAWFTGRI